MTTLTTKLMRLRELQRLKQEKDIQLLTFNLRWSSVLTSTLFFLTSESLLKRLSQTTFTRDKRQQRRVN